MKKTKKPNAQQLVAALNRHDTESLQRLLAQGADPNAHDHDDYHGDVPVLIHAAGIQFAEGVQALLKAGADPKATMSGGLGARGGGTALHHAIFGSDNRSGSDTKRSTLADRLNIVEMLLKAGADPNAVDQGDKLPLYLAACSGYYEIVERLIEAGATFKTWPAGCIPPLIGAANFGSVPEGRNQERVAELLLRLGAPVDGESKGWTALMTVAAKGSENLVNLHLNNGADVNHRSNDDGYTPFLCAAVFARDAVTDREHHLALRIIKRLLEAGADPTARNADGESAYDISSRFRRSPASEYLKRVVEHRA